MKAIYSFSILSILSLCVLSCSEDNEFVQAGALKVVHASTNTDGLHVVLSRFNDDFIFSNNPILDFGDVQRFTFRGNDTRNLTLVNSADTTASLANQEVTLASGEITTMFVTGNNNNVGVLLLTDNLIQHQDSTAGFRFINLSPDAPTVTFEATNVLITNTLGF